MGRDRPRSGGPSDGASTPGSDRWGAVTLPDDLSAKACGRTRPRPGACGSRTDGLLFKGRQGQTPARLHPVPRYRFTVVS